MPVSNNKKAIDPAKFLTFSPGDEHHSDAGDDVLDELSGCPSIPPPFMLPPSVVGTDFAAYWAACADKRKACDDTDDEG